MVIYNVNEIELCAMKEIAKFIEHTDLLLSDILFHKNFACTLPIKKLSETNR